MESLIALWVSSRWGTASDSARGDSGSSGSSLGEHVFTLVSISFLTTDTLSRWDTDSMTLSGGSLEARQTTSSLLSERLLMRARTYAAALAKYFPSETSEGFFLGLDCLRTVSCLRECNSLTVNLSLTTLRPC